MPLHILHIRIYNITYTYRIHSLYLYNASLAYTAVVGTHRFEALAPFTIVFGWNVRHPIKHIFVYIYICIERTKEEENM